MLKKNEIIKLRIEDTGVNGEGIGRFEGCTFFVKDAVIGDTVKAVITRMKKDYGYAKTLEVTDSSPFRIKAPCALARRCGGCQLMELDYEKQLAFKERKVRMNLERIGGFRDPKILPIIGMEDRFFEEGSVPLRYRNKMQFPIGRNRDGSIAAGFYAGRTHFIVDTEDCMAAPEVCSIILQCVRSFIGENKISVYNEQTGQGLVRHLVLRTGFFTGEIMVCLVLNGESLGGEDCRKERDPEQELVKKLTALSLPCTDRDPSLPEYRISSICINENRENTNVILGKHIRCIYGRAHIYDSIAAPETEDRLMFKISPLSFYQINPVQMERLYAKALEFAELSGRETVWDLYCGTGTISLFLAGKAKQVRGVEIVPEAIEDAKENAKLNGIHNAEFFCGKAEEVFPESMESLRLSGAPRRETVVVLDPPRKGCDRRLLEALLETGPDRIVYVSCDSATLARDLKILSGEERGKYRFRVKKIQPVDMFPNSVHVEAAVLLEREGG